MLHSTQHTAPGLDSQLRTLFPSGRRRGSRRAAAATSPTRADLPRPRRWRGQACTAGAGPRGREGRRARRARERRRRRLARAGLRGVGRGTTCSGRSARSAQLGDDEGDHAARSASRGQEPTPSPLSTRVEDRDEPAAQARPGWRIETGQGGEAGADAPHASSRARRVERRLVGASVGAFGRRNAKEACQRDGLVPRNCNALGSRTSRGGPPGQIWARPSPRAVAASNGGLERGWSAGWGGGSSGVAGARGGVNVLHAPAGPGRACGALRKNVFGKSCGARELS